MSEFSPRFRYDPSGQIVDKRKTDVLVELSKIPPRSQLRPRQPTDEILSGAERPQIVQGIFHGNREAQERAARAQGARMPETFGDILSGAERSGLMPQGEPLRDIVSRWGGNILDAGRAVGRAIPTAGELGQGILDTVRTAPELARVAATEAATTIPQAIELGAGLGSGAGAALHGRPFLPAFDEGVEDVRKRIPFGEESAQALDEAYTAAAKKGAPLAATLLTAMAVPGAPVTKATKAVVGTAKTVRRAARGLAAVNFRTMQPKAALRAARKGVHLIPDAKTGQITGGPRGFDTKKVRAQRRVFDSLVKEGLGGSDWYEKMKDTITEMAGYDAAAADDLAARLAIYSSQATPETNLGFAISDVNARNFGDRPTLSSGETGVRTSAQWRQASDLRQKPAMRILGPKQEIYYTQGNPTRPGTHTGTNDIFHARAFGFQELDPKTGELRPWSSGLSPQQHTYMDGETLLAVDRANKKKLGGRGDWTASEIQASAWVAAKAKSLEKARPSLTRAGAFDEANKGYGDYLEKHTANVPIEETPGRAAGHLPEIIDSSFEDKRAYAAAGGSSRDESGRDILSSASGFYNRPMLEATGLYTPKAAPGVGPVGAPKPEINPVDVARPLVSFEPGSPPRVSARDMDILQKQEFFRALFGAQEMSAPHFMSQRGPVGEMQGLTIPAGRKLTADEISKLSAVGEGHGLWTSDVGNRVNMGPFDPASTGEDLRKAFAQKGAGGLKERIGNILGVQPERASVIGRPEYLQDDWRASAKSLESAPLTERLLEYAPDLQGLDSPLVRAKQLKDYARDADLGKRGGTVNEKLQNLRHAFGTGGWRAVQLAFKHGVPLPAMAVILHELGGTSQEPGA